MDGSTAPPAPPPAAPPAPPPAAPPAPREAGAGLAWSGPRARDLVELLFAPGYWPLVCGFPGYTICALLGALARRGLAEAARVRPGVPGVLEEIQLALRRTRPARAALEAAARAGGAGPPAPPAPEETWRRMAQARRRSAERAALRECERRFAPCYRELVCGLTRETLLKLAPRIHARGVADLASGAAPDPRAVEEIERAWLRARSRAGLAEERDAEERDAEERDAEERDAEERDAEERDAEERDAEEKAAGAPPAKADPSEGGSADEGSSEGGSADEGTDDTVDPEAGSEGTDDPEEEGEAGTADPEEGGGGGGSGGAPPRKRARTWARRAPEAWAPPEKAVGPCYRGLLAGLTRRVGCGLIVRFKLAGLDAVLRAGEAPPDPRILGPVAAARRRAGLPGGDARAAGRAAEEVRLLGAAAIGPRFRPLAGGLSAYALGKVVLWAKLEGLGGVLESGRGPLAPLVEERLLAARRRAALPAAGGGGAPPARPDAPPAPPPAPRPGRAPRRKGARRALCERVFGPGYAALLEGLPLGALDTLIMRLEAEGLGALVGGGGAAHPDVARVIRAARARAGLPPAAE